MKVGARGFSTRMSNLIPCSMEFAYVACGLCTSKRNCYVDVSPIQCVFTTGKTSSLKKEIKAKKQRKWQFVQSCCLTQIKINSSLLLGPLNSCIHLKNL